MYNINELLDIFRNIASNPGEQLKKTVSSGKKAVGVLPYFCPEELADAAGMVPFGIWGSETQVLEAKRYFPAFICSLLQTALELGIRGVFDDLSAVMIPNSCDSLKGMSANWRYGVKKVRVIDVSYAQNRKTDAGVEFTVTQFKKVRDSLQEIAGRKITDEDVNNSIAVYNQNRAALRDFVKTAARHPNEISPADRCSVIKAGYFMQKSEHTALVTKLTDALNALPVSEWKGLRVVTSGIIADSPALLKIFADNNVCIVGDQITYESGYYQDDTPVTSDPFVGMAERVGNIEGCSVLYDPGKKRAAALANLARETGANGVIYILTKFCDPEEFDYVPVKKALNAAGIPVLLIETDMQMTDYGQARSAIEAFREILA